MEVRVRHGQGKQTEAFARFSEGGTDSGMTPPELMLSALGLTAKPAGWRL
jgi:hypothetical protein